ncbi:CpaF family protein [Lachnobacterium bovis]|uniref:Pilus assembly protein CpaF n=1 Tax=Lachnobacterium bovis TaxID=140626 RepID=A0A1H9SVQ3_9FIRM|nr:CpaF family protein [Lachnobacterium bovis]SER88927.1 pilus assembly protein CpaF [Lachnobacterium bovis]
MNNSDTKIYENIREDVLKRLDFTREVDDEEIKCIIGEETVKNLNGINFKIQERIELEKSIFNSLRKFDVLQDLIDNPQVSEIMINGPKNIFYEEAGIIKKSNLNFASEEKLHDVIQQIVGKHNRVVNEANPIVDTRLPNGSRVNIVLAPISLNGSSISIRKFPSKPLEMDDLIKKCSITEEAAVFLKMLVKARYNIFISGGTSSGKTTFLNALSQFINSDERIITIEDSAELQIQGVENIVRLETRNANVDGVTPITIRDLIKSALRMRPDRIIVGECRGEETLDMLQAMNTGHDGSLSTGHANSSRDILYRIETMVLMGVDIPLPAIRSQIASGIDIIVHLGRCIDKSRKVLEIAEVNGLKNGEIQLNKIYEINSENILIKCNELINQDKLIMSGVI